MYSLYQAPAFLCDASWLLKNKNRKIITSFFDIFVSLKYHLVTVTFQLPHAIRKLFTQSGSKNTDFVT